MPTYQYTCTECGEPVEAVQKFTDPPLTVCANCGGRLRKVFSPVGIVFKGSGFYRTDSRTANGAKEAKDAAARDGKGKDAKDTPAKGGSAAKDTAAKDAKSSGPADKAPAAGTAVKKSGEKVA